MPKINNKHVGYVCFPYLHNHQSIEVKDLWFNSRNIDSLFFVTATFSDYSKPYFPSPTNHYILAKFKGLKEANKEILSQDHENFSFVFNTHDIIFDRKIGSKTNFISIYYLERNSFFFKFDGFVYNNSKIYFLHKTFFYKTLLYPILGSLYEISNCDFFLS